MAEARIDKWMWAARIFKTRTIAAEACKKGRICINGAQAKPARMIKPGDVIQVKKPPITYSFKVLQAIEKRVGAKLVPEIMENVTTPDQYELLEMSKISGFVNRAKGTGRPTKKDRRDLDEFFTPEYLDDFDFDFDSFDKKFSDTKPDETPKEEPKEAPKPAPAKSKNNKDKKNNAQRNDAPSPAQPRPAGNSTLDVLKQKGYEVITAATVKNSVIDFIGVSDKQINLCLLDKEPGDWLADEERFNDEEPLWFSESSHRISPVRKVDLARKILSEKLAESDMNFEIRAFVVVQIGNIINAEDMFETWDEMNISVTRIDRGTPKELKLFSKTLEEAGGHIDKDKFEKVKKLVRSIA